MVACPSCTQQIHDQAIVCKYCGHELKPGAAQILDFVVESISAAGRKVAERHLRTQAALRILLAPVPFGQGPLRMEAWASDKWTPEQRKAYAQLRAEADLPPEEAPG